MVERVNEMQKLEVCWGEKKKKVGIMGRVKSAGK